MYRSSKRRNRNNGRNGKPAERVPNMTSLAYLASLARAGDDETVNGLMRSVAYTRDPEIAQVAGEYIESLAVEQFLDPDVFAPPVEPDDARGEIDIGWIGNSGCMFGLRLEEIIRHTLIEGSSGSGKTTLIKKILKEVLSI